ncbi:MAG: TlpA disulfide reductase family protein [Bryobacterales bacterium]|nr:TlpA disulfide reductase family protein [Bryobacterales bacterium]
MPALERVNEDFADRGVDILAVNLGEDPDVVRKFVEEQGHTFCVVPDPESRVGSLFGVRSLPTQVVVGPGSRIEWIRVGYSSRAEDELRAVVERLVGPGGQGEVR